MRYKYFVLMLFFFHFCIYAQDSLKYKQPQQFYGSVKSNPFMMIWGHLPFTAEYRLMYELTMGERQSLQVGISYFGESPLFNLPGAGGVGNTIILRGFRFQLMHKFYVRKDSWEPLGWYFAPDLSYSSAILSIRNQLLKNHYFKAEQTFICAVIGKQRKVGRNLCIDWFFGAGYKKYNVYENFSNGIFKSIDPGILSEYLNWPLKIRFGCNFGFLF